MAVKDAPIVKQGGSTGFAPIHVRISTVDTNTQNVVFFRGENFLFNFCEDKDITINPRIDPAIATTPPSFDGIERKIA